MTKKISVTKSNIIEEFLMTFLASTSVFHKNIDLSSLTFFIDARHFLVNCSSQGLPLDDKTILFFEFFMKLMAFKTLELFLFRKKN